MTNRRLILGIGCFALFIGLLATFIPGLVPVELEQPVVWVIGFGALLMGWYVAQQRRDTVLRETAVSDPERPLPIQPPGETFESALVSFLETPRVSYRPNQIRNGLRTAAIQVLKQYEAFSESAAVEAIDRGTWTEDSYARALLAREESLSSKVTARGWLKQESTFQRGVRHTVAEIARIAGNDSEEIPPHNSGVHRHSIGDREEQERFVALSGAHELETGHWSGVTIFALLGLGIGFIVQQPAIVLAGVAGIGYAAYAHANISPPGKVTIDREVSQTQPRPGQDVSVTVQVTNETDRFLADIRVVDGVPEMLSVTDGSPRLGTALRPGERTSFSYTVTARRGVHEFGETIVIARDLPSTSEHAKGHNLETSLTCVPRLRPLPEPVPLRAEATQYVGPVQTISGGEGIEFYATREYRPSDSLSRIDWNRRAKTGELATIEYREERAATIIVVIDARIEAYVSPEPSLEHALDRCIDGAGQVFARLVDDGDRVGVAAIGSDLCWVPPTTGRDHRLMVRETLATNPVVSSTPPEEMRPLRHIEDELADRLPPGSQLFLLSPLCDDYIARFARRFEAYGYPVSIVTPDPTTAHTTGHLLARVGRDLRITSLRRHEMPVIEWEWDDPLAVAIARHRQRWSQ